jgi:hypothetical protein
VQIDAMTGEQTTFDPAEHELSYLVLKQQAAATAVNQAIIHSTSHSGSLGGGTVLARPADHLAWIMCGAG